MVKCDYTPPHQNLQVLSILGFIDQLVSGLTEHTTTPSSYQCVFNFFFPGEMAASREMKNERLVHLKNAVSRDKKDKLIYITDCWFH